MFYGHLTSTLIILISLKSCIGNQNPAKIWGFEGEAWKTELLLDYSFTGFAAKERGFPEPPFAANILDFGAIGDGELDCTGPFLGAIDHVKSLGGGTIIIPSGKYLLKQRIVLDGDNIVLQGEGPGSTILYYDEPLSRIDDRDVDALLKKTDGLAQSPYAWNDGVLQIKGYDTGSHSPNGRHDPGWIVENAPIGSRKLRLDSVVGLAPGQWVRVIQSDVNGTLASNLYGTNAAKIEEMKNQGIECEPECATDIDDERDLLKWGSRILAIESQNVVVLQRSLPFDVSTDWKARLMPVPSSMARENGIKDLSIEFKWAKARPHHHDVGSNAILVENAFNTYIQNVHVMNVEQGFLLKNAQLATLDMVKIGTTKPRNSSSVPWDGHIGIGLYDCSDIEVSNFDIRGEWLHDISLRGTTLSAIHSGRGDDLRLDTHRSAPYAILFSNIYLGKGSRPFGTGGFLSRGLPVARFTTYYNLRRANWSPIDMPSSTVAGECTWGKKVNYIGSFRGKKCPGYHVESYPMGSLIPEDIYSSMVDRKARIRAIYQGGVVPYSEQKLVRNALQSATISENTSELQSSAAGDGSYPLVPAPEFY